MRVTEKDLLKLSRNINKLEVKRRMFVECVKNRVGTMKIESEAVKLALEAKGEQVIRKECKKW